MSGIRVFDYLAQYGTLKPEILAAVERVLGSGQLILGPEVRAFEQEFAAFLGAGGDAVGVNSGTDALEVALRALGVGPGDDVVTVANTAVPTVSAIRAVGAMPVFCDVDPATCLMDLAQLPAAITARTRAIIPVHLFGNVVDVPRVREIVAGRGIRIVEDCAQAHGAALRGRMAGTLGDISAFSFYPTKNLGAYGDGGLCWSGDPDLVHAMRRIRMYGFENAYYAECEGINSRLDEVQAAILRVKLRHFPRFLASRRELAQRYAARLPPRARPIVAGPGVQHAWHLFVVSVPERDRVRSALARRAVDTGIHYPHPIHRMRGYEFLKYADGSLPQTEALAGSVLSLPMYPELATEAVDTVCAELSQVLS